MHISFFIYFFPQKINFKMKDFHSINTNFSNIYVSEICVLPTYDLSSFIMTIIMAIFSRKNKMVMDRMLTLRIQ